MPGFMVGDRPQPGDRRAVHGEHSTLRFLDLAIVVGVAALVRWAHLAAIAAVPFANQPVGDARGYLEWARRLAGGDWLGGECFYQAPLYPYLSGVVLRFFGDSLSAILVAQMIGGSLACAAVALAAGRLFDRRVGLVAGLMLALYAPAIFYDGIIQKTSLTGLLVAAVFLFAVELQHRPRAWIALALGVAASLLSLTRENALLWLALLPVWMVIELRRRRPRERIMPLVMYALGAALILVPVAARNLSLCGSFSLTTFQSGPNFYIGNGSEADGLYRPLVRGHETPEFERTDATRLAEQATGRPLSPKEVSSYWWSRAFGEIGEAPLRWLGLLGRKALIVLNQYEVPDVEGAHVYAEYSLVLALTSLAWHFGLLAPLATLGISLTWSDRRRLWLLYVLPLTMAAAVAVFFVLGRYRFPLVAPLVIFAAVGVVEAWRCWRRRLGARLVKPLVATLVATAIVNWPLLDEERLDSLGWMNLGVAAAQQQNLSAAESFLQRAVEGNPHSAEAHANLGHVLTMLARDGEAVGRYERALEISPELADVHFFAAQAYERLGDTEAAAGHYRGALRINPADVEAEAALQRLAGSATGEP